jgi:type II secretory pathway component PulF
VALSIVEPRIGTKDLAVLSRRLATSLGAGVDVRTVFAREAMSARGASHRRLDSMREAVEHGSSISDALDETGRYFPELFRELVRVGEHSGHLPEVFRQLAEHYDHQLRLRRVFLSSISWPVIELILALSVVGALIWLMGAIPTLQKNNTDLLGLGLTGNSGLVTYLAFLGCVAFAGVLVYRAMTRGVFWAAPIQRVIMAVPRLGSTLRTLALARLAWSMNVTLNSGMDLRGALKMSLASTNNAVYTRHIDSVLAAVRRGDEIHEAFAETGDFPPDFLATIEVGEQSGRLVESMAHLAQQYQDQARAAMNVLSVLMGVAVMGLISALIIFFIFQIYSRAVLGPINDALKMKI